MTKAGRLLRASKLIENSWGGSGYIDRYNGVANYPNDDSSKMKRSLPSEEGKAADRATIEKIRKEEQDKMATKRAAKEADKKAHPVKTALKNFAQKVWDS